MSLKCREIRAKLSDKLDGRLDWGEVPSVQAHLRDCPDCRAYSHECELLVSWLRDVPPVASPNVLTGVIAGLAARRDAPRPVPRWRGRLLALAAVVVVATVSGILLWNIGDQPDADVVVLEDAAPAEENLETTEPLTAPTRLLPVEADVARSDEAPAEDSAESEIEARLGQTGVIADPEPSHSPH